MQATRFMDLWIYATVGDYTQGVDNIRLYAVLSHYDAVPYDSVVFVCFIR